VHGYALVFSITSRETFERIEPINEALLNALGDAQDVPRVLVGSMKDLAHQRQVSMQVGVGVRIVTVGAYRGFGSSRYTMFSVAHRYFPTLPTRFDSTRLSTHALLFVCCCNLRGGGDMVMTGRTSAG